MAGIFKSQGGFAVTPHKVSVCILLQIYAPPAQISVPFPFSSVAQHNRLGLFLLALTKSCDDILEPKLEELINQLREVGGLLDHWLIDHLTSRLSSLASPDDLFNFFSEMRGILGGPDSGVVEDDQIILDPNSNLGMFLRRCVLAFNVLSFEGVCHLLTNIGMYCKETLSSCPYGASELDDTRNDSETLPEYESMDLENLVFQKVSEEIEARKRTTQSIPFHFHMPEALSGLVEDVDVPSYRKCKSTSKAKETYSYSHSLSNTSRDIDPSGSAFLRTNWQMQGYLDAQAEKIEKVGSLFSLNAFEVVLKQLQKMAPELHRVHFLRYLNTLYHDDYFSALENVHRYFDYSAGTEGFDFVPPGSGCNSFGRYEIALLCLGMMHVHFGHPKQALEVLTEAVHVSQQQSNDTCLAYTLAAIGNLLSESGFSRTSGILGSSYSPLMSMGISLSVQQQLFVLLTESLRRAESLKLKQLVASNHLAMAKFHLMEERRDILFNCLLATVKSTCFSFLIAGGECFFRLTATHVQRPLLSFGPRASAKLRTSPISVCKELRLSTHLICQYGTESSTKTTDGSFSTAWLKNLQKPVGSHVLSGDNECGDNSSELPFFAQPTSIPGSVLQLLGSSYLLRATAFEIYGSAPLARINAILYATCFADASSSSDASLAYVKLIQHLAIFKGYKEAFAALKVAEERFLSLSKSRILLLKLQLVHEHALHRGCLKLAQQACNELGVLASSVTGVDLDLKTEASFRHARTLLAANQFSEAARVAHSLFCLCYKYNLQVQNASVLLLLAEIHKKSGNAVLGLPYALASLSFCQSFNLDLLKASATLTIAELWLSLGPSHSKRALNLLHGAFPMILGHGGLELRARAFIAEVKCYLCSPSFSVSEDPDVVLDSLKQASEELQLLEYHEMAAEAFYLMAMVFHKLGRLEEREEAAHSFKKHIMALENPEEGESSPLIIS